MDDETKRPRADNGGPVSQFMVNGEPHVVCQGCGAIVCAHDQGTVPDEGLIVTLRGYYGGFTDTMPGDDPIKLTLCHECSLAVWRSIPRLRDERGLHSTRADEACCEYHWTFGHDADGKVDRVIHGDGTTSPVDKRGYLI